MSQQSRYDIYAFIHKGLRAAMSQSLVTLGNLDAQDDAELLPALQATDTLLAMCRAHVGHENTFVHPAMEQRRPDSSRVIAHEHAEHIEEIEALRQEVQRLRRLPSLRRAEPLLQFYRRFAVFMAENFMHMAKEEREHNAVLWACYGDAEIAAIEAELVSHIDPELLPAILSCMLQAMAPAERAEFLGALRPSMPADAFASLIGHIAPLLSPSHRAKLGVALQLQTGPLQKTA
jgi:hypothetical protein